MSDSPTTATPSLTHHEQLVHRFDQQASQSEQELNRQIAAQAMYLEQLALHLFISFMFCLALCGGVVLAMMIFPII